MPKTKTVTTQDGSTTFELRPNDFCEQSRYETDGVANRATRVQIRRAIKALDKFLKKNPNPEPIQSLFTSDFAACTTINTGYGDVRNNVDEYNVRHNQFGGISIGCMVFDKKTTTKIRNWANAATATKATTKKSPRKAPLAKAA